MSNYSNRWTVGEWTFYEVENHERPGFENQPLYFYRDGEDGGPVSSAEFYPSLDWAMVAAIAEKYTGPRGGGGSGLGTAADWFMKMIGAHELKPAGENGTTALMAAMELSNGFPPVGEFEWAERIAKSLERRGYVIARQP